MLPCDNSMLTNDWPERSRPLTTDSEHVLSGLVNLDEDSVVDLPQPEELEDLLDLGGHLVDTTDPHNKDELSLSGDIVVAVLLGITLKPKLKTYFRKYLVECVPRQGPNKQNRDKCLMFVLCLMMEH